MLGAVGLSPGLVMKLIHVLGCKDFQVLTENHPGAVSSKLCNISSLPIWHCFDLNCYFLGRGIRTGNRDVYCCFLNKSTIILLLSMSCILVSSEGTLM